MNCLEWEASHGQFRCPKEKGDENKPWCVPNYAKTNRGASPITPDEAVSVMLTLRQGDFYKSMTTHADHQIWQDVYHAKLKSRTTAYIKVTLRENGVVVIQFKEK